MKLSEKEAHILACVELRADLPMRQVVHETGYREHTIRYCLNSLELRGVIRRAAFINLAPAGYGFYGMYFTAGSGSGRAVKSMFASLKRERQIIWAAELGGDYQYAMAFASRSIYQVQEYLSDLSTRFPGIFGDKAVSCQFSATALGHRQLSSKKLQSLPLSIAPIGATVDLDTLDCKIIGGLVNEEYRSRRQLAQILKLPLSTLDLRIRKLEEKKVIAGFVYLIDPSAIGLQEHIVLIQTRGIDTRFKEALFAYIKKCPQITYVYECFGNWDYELNLEVAHGTEVTDISAELLELFPSHINSIKTLTKYRDIKLTFVPF